MCFHFTLFIDSRRSSSRQAFEQLHGLAEIHLANAYTIEIIDFIDHIETFEARGVTMVPTLDIRTNGGPPRRFIRDTSFYKEILISMGMRHTADKMLNEAKHMMEKLDH